MLDLLILTSALVFGYAFLRSYGGKGLSIKTEFAPASTPEGRKERSMAWIVLAIMTAAVVFVFTHNQNNISWLTLVIPALISLPAVLLRIRKK